MHYEESSLPELSLDEEDMAGPSQNQVRTHQLPEVDMVSIPRSQWEGI